MATRLSFFRLKAIRKFGVSFWPWRKLNLKQANLLAKVAKKRRLMAVRQHMKRRQTPRFYQTEAKKLLSLLYGKLHASYLTTLLAQTSSTQSGEGTAFFQALESRLDVVLHRAHFAPTINAARQLITHGTILVNQALCVHPGYMCQPGDVIRVAPHAVQRVGESMQTFLRAPNTMQAFHTVGQTQPFRKSVRPRPYRWTSARMRGSQLKTCVINRRNYRLARFANKLFQASQESGHHAMPMMPSVMHTHTQGATQTLAFSHAETAVRVRLRMCAKRRRAKHMVRVVRTHRRTLGHMAGWQMARPKTRLQALRFERTASGVPVKLWASHMAQVSPRALATPGQHTCLPWPKATHAQHAHMEKRFWAAKRVRSFRRGQVKMRTLWYHKPVAEGHALTREKTSSVSGKRSRASKVWVSAHAARRASLQVKRWVTRKVFYKPMHVEVNYHTLHMVFLFPPQQVFLPVQIAVRHVIQAFQR